MHQGQVHNFASTSKLYCTLAVQAAAELPAQMAEERGRSDNAGADTTLPQLGAAEKMDLDPPAAVRYASLLAEVQASSLCRLRAFPVKCKHWRLGACHLWCNCEV